MSEIRYTPTRVAAKIALPLLILIAGGILFSGCAGPEGGSSIPWAEPEPWENQPTFGVPY